MDLDECIAEYARILGRVFNKDKQGWPINWRGHIKGRFDSSLLEELFTDTLQKRGLSKDELLADSKENTTQRCRV